MRKFLLLVALLIFSSCSALESLKSSNTQNILIETPHVEGAECNLSDKAGRKWRLFDTPATIAVQEGHPPLVIICTKKGFKTSVLTINEHKEELLIIDGKHIDVSIYGDFPTKFPRLIPAAIKETAGFVQDPTGSISTTYPNKVIVWMEPKKWESEEQMREWAFDREVEDRAEFINGKEAKLTDEQRKEKRRAEKKKRDEDVKKLKKRLQDAGKRGVKNTLKLLNPDAALNNAVEGGKVILNNSTGIDNVRQSVEIINEETGNAIRKGVKTVGNELKPETGKPLNSLNPGAAVDFLNERNNIKERTRSERLKNSPDAIDGQLAPAINSKDANSPQDLFDNQGGYKIKYDEKGNRIVP
jgi:hypothetical protein